MAEHFLANFAAQSHKPLSGFSEQARQVLEHYDWPGNVRELRNAVERGVIFCEQSTVELDHLVEIMKKYPGMEIELSSHTDQRGTDAYNNRLSQCRAESAVNYIISKGIDKSRITAVGFGKTKLIQDCTKVQGCPTTSQGDCPCHQNNRRTEVKILKM